MRTKATSLFALAAAGLLQFTAAAQVTLEAPMQRGDTAATQNGWTSTPIFTVGEATASGYLPVGLCDGIGAFPFGPNTAALLVNHELGADKGYPYSLRNGTQMTGARVSYFIIERTLDALGQPVVKVKDAGAAIRTIHDRSGQVVTNPAQVNETGVGMNGFSRFCSSQSVLAGTYGFQDFLYFTGEESSKPGHPHGGTEWVLDAVNRTLWAAPALGRGAWENATPLETGDPNQVALLLGSDTAGAPLYLYVGTKGAAGTGSFLDRNGLEVGKLFAWKASGGDLSPQDFHGVNEARSGSFVELTVKDATSAGLPGYDAAGYLDDDTLSGLADSLGCFSFSRPEDLATNPVDGTQVAFASTGRGSLYPADNWGTLYVVDVDFPSLAANIVIVHDADGLAVPDSGLRSPDNVTWASNGKIYAQEDRSTSPGALFGAATGIEASIWEIDPVTRAFERIVEIDRSVLAPAGVTDAGAGDLGNWESSGILDVTALFETRPGERLLIGTVQAHGLQDGPIGGGALLVQGGQLLFHSKIGD